MAQGRPKTSPWNNCPDIVADVRCNLTEIFSRLTEPDANGCVRYQGAHHSNGYGMCSGYRISTDKRIMMTVHRLLLKIKMNSDLKGVDAIHSCGNMWCHAEAHLFAGTEKDIAAGVTARGTRPKHSCKGGTLGRMRNQKYKYDTHDIIDLHYDRITIQDFASKYSIEKSLAKSLKTDMRAGRAYKWVKNEEYK